MLNIANMTKNMEHSKAYQPINDAINRMFREIESCASGADSKQTATQLRTISALSGIETLKEIVKANHGDLPPIEFETIMRLLVMAKEGTDMAMQKKKPLKDEFYEILLNGFKEIWWVNIPIEKLDFNEQ